jgi:isopenicillin-N N-acyltransferase-like protein
VPEAADRLLRVHGTHEQVGTQIGTACRDAIRRATRFTREQLPTGRSLEDQLELADEYRSVTAAALPWLLVELDAVADAAGVDRRHLFAAGVEEIWPGRDTTARVSTPAFRGCTDVAAVAPATGEHRTLVGHNNDLPASVQDDVVAIEWRVDGCPTVLSLGVGPWLSTAWNSTGLSITGNELAPNDERVGIPRLLLMSAVARAGSLDEARALASSEERASSYNWVLADSAGRVSCLEGSASAMVEMGVDARGLLHHENHYAHASMQQYERSPRHAARSDARGRRVAELLAEVEPGALTPTRLRQILSDHQGAPESICRHAVSENDMHTVFWAIADPARLEVEYGLGPPCTSAAQMYRFA